VCDHFLGRIPTLWECSSRFPAQPAGEMSNTRERKTADLMSPFYFVPFDIAKTMPRACLQYM